MSCKILLVIFAVICVVGSLEAASLKIVQKPDSVVHKLDYEEVQENVRGSRQTNVDDASAEDSDEDDDEDNAEELQQNIIRQQQAQQQAAADSGSDEDEDGDDEEDDDDDDDDSFFGRRLKRDVAESETNNEIADNSKPSTEEEKETSEASENSSSTDAEAISPSAPASPNTSVLILIRDAIKKVTTELPNTQQVAASAQQYFQMFEHFLQQTIEQVIGDDDDDIEVESTTIPSELVASETADKETDSQSESADKESADKESAGKESPVTVPEVKPETIETSQVVETKA